jgi:starvation-inducible DNA-binding protein
MRRFGEVGTNVVRLDITVTEPVCEELNIALASFQSLYLQYQNITL